MLFRSILQQLLRTTARSALRETITRATDGQLAPTTAASCDVRPEAGCLGLVFALGIEAGCLEDLLKDVVTTRGEGFVVCQGRLATRPVAVVRSGPGERNAARATHALIDGHRPSRVVSAGLAGGLSPELHRNDILIADRLLHQDGRRIILDLPEGLSTALRQPGVYRGTLLTTNRVVRLPAEKQAWFSNLGALAVDMETFAVAEVCLQRQVPFVSIRVINDTADETLPLDVENLLAQKTTAARLGATLGAVWRRPGSAADIYRLRENALIASDRLARFLLQYRLD